MSKLSIPDESLIKKFNWINQSDIKRVINVLDSGVVNAKHNNCNVFPIPTSSIIIPPLINVGSI